MAERRTVWLRLDLHERLRRIAFDERTAISRKLDEAVESYLARPEYRTTDDDERTGGDDNAD